MSEKVHTDMPKSHQQLQRTSAMSIPSSLPESSPAYFYHPISSPQPPRIFSIPNCPRIIFSHFLSPSVFLTRDSTPSICGLGPAFELLV